MSICEHRPHHPTDHHVISCVIVLFSPSSYNPDVPFFLSSHHHLILLVSSRDYYYYYFSGVQRIISRQDKKVTTQDTRGEKELKDLMMRMMIMMTLTMIPLLLFISFHRIWSSCIFFVSLPLVLCLFCYWWWEKKERQVNLSSFFLFPDTNFSFLYQKLIIASHVLFFCFFSQLKKSIKE